MSRPVLIAAVALALGAPALAQEAPGAPAPFEMPRADEPPPGETRPYGLPGSGDGPLDNFFADLLGRAQPHLEGLARDMTGLMSEYGPVFQEFTKLIDDIGNYELPPERQPNGDIILRRKAEAPPPPPLDELNRLVPDRPEQPENPPAPRIPQARPQIEL